MNDTITVIIPTYNKAAYISQTIESVLRQTYQDFEIIIIDDCSKDDTELVVQKYLSEKIRYFKHAQNWGPGATFNDGIKKARTEYVTLIASDDVLLPAHLELVINEFKKDKKTECVQKYSHTTLSGLFADFERIRRGDIHFRYYGNNKNEDIQTGKPQSEQFARRSIDNT